MLAASMRHTVRLVALSALLLLLFLAAALLAQTWLQRQNTRAQADAIEAKRKQFLAAANLTASQPDRWSPEHLRVIGELIDAKVMLGTAAQTGTANGKIRFVQPLPDSSGAITIEFNLPHLARLSLLHGRTWGILLVGALALMFVFVSLGLILGRRGGAADTRQPWPSAKAEMNSLEQLARTSVARGAALEEERDNRRRIERDLSLHQQLQNQALEEKIRLGRDLHDGLIQSLYAVGLTIEAARPLIARDPTKADQKLGVCLEALNGAIRKVREYITGLSPEKLRRMNFADAVQLFVNELSAGREIGLTSVIDEDAAVRLTVAQTTEALQIVHEAISNALRHGQATQLTVRLHRGDAEIGLLVQDNGAGFDSQANAGSGHGLGNMTARAQGVGATLRIDSAVGTGTRIVVTFPFSKPA